MVDAVMHGVFDENAKLAAGLTTVNDIWNIIPYENLIVTATLSPDEIKSVMEEVYASHEPRSLLGIAVRVEGRGLDRRITSMTFPDGRALERDKRYVIAVNSFDARSGGHHFMKLRALLDRPEANCVLHPVQTRDAVIDYFRRHKVVQRIATRDGSRRWRIAASVGSLGMRSCGLDFARMTRTAFKAFRLPISPCDFGFLLCWFVAEC